VRETMAVFRKEMRAYLVSPIPYLLAAFFAALLAYLVFDKAYFFLLKQATLEGLFRFMPLAMVVIVPAIAMRLWSEELRGGTFETLLTFPVRTRHLVLGKWLAAWVVIGGCLLATVGLVVTAATLGNLDMGPTLGGYLGSWLMGGAFLAIGLWLSSLTSNQIVAFILGVVVCAAFVFMEDAAGKFEGGAVAQGLSNLGVTTHFQAIGRGVVDLRDVFYFVSVIGFFLYLNVETIENRRSR
jgi:ABC-2 type transport system permease protein